MLKISRKVEYALIAMLYMSEKSADDLTTNRELSLRFKIPQELLGKILQSLSKQGLIQSVQGVKGGYRVTRSLDKISVNKIIKVLDGPIHFVACTHSTVSECGRQHLCNIKTPMQVIQCRLNKLFETIMLKDLQKYNLESLKKGEVF